MFGDVMFEPLAIKLRPTKISEVIGQSHLVDSNKIISNMIRNKKIFSMILYGPPGVGKTSLAWAIVNQLDLRYKMLNAVINSKSDIDSVIAEARLHKGLVVILDEYHRLNKDKQDVLLPHLESGLIILIGLTTINPYKRINPAIRSRVHIFELKKLSILEIKKGLKNAIVSGFLKDIEIDSNCLNYIAEISGGDLRSAYNLLEIAYFSTSDGCIDLDVIKNINQLPISFSDNSEDGYYNTLSAFQKSIRGSDVNASLHYLSRLLETGDLESVFRRLSVIVYEDIGLANPNMGIKVNCAINASQMVGLPEASLILANIVIELALSPKSNTAYKALKLAQNDIKLGKGSNIPNHLKNHSKDYIYPHDFKESIVKQQYLPNDLINKEYYFPKENSKYELMLKKIYENLKRKL